jgi:hypothetical protein
MHGKTCGEECKGGCEASKGGACCTMSSCNGCACGCGHKTVRIIIKIALVIIIFWLGMHYGERKSFGGYGKYGGMMRGDAVPMMGQYR